VARILLTTFGSYGDLHPYMAVGLELRGRGHAVTIATSAVYAAKVESEGLAFHAVRPDLTEIDSSAIERLMDARRGTERVVRFLANATRGAYEDSRPAVRQADLVVTHPITFGGVLAVRQAGVRWISSVLAPISFMSACDPPVPAPTPWLVQARKLGVGFMRLLWRVAMLSTRPYARPIIDLRRELGLPDTGNPLFEGANSPRRVLALFSRHLADPQPDWPEQAVVTGFPFFDRHHEEQPPPELERFLADGPSPIVFTLGTSAVTVAGRFYRESLQAVQHLGARAVFLTGPYPQDLPEKLPSGILAAPYAPYSELFPRAAAIVHQGGIGTTAQAIRSGRPMLIVPFAHDQFDNAERVRRLGAARVIYRSRYNAGRVERALGELASCEAAARRIGELVRAESGAADAADAIEAELK
jgi:rhamnosyltransferase subunit B